MLTPQKTTWNDAQRTGSLSIFIWESTDLVNWGTDRLVKVENDEAGMVWAPEAIWDPEAGQYLVHWASKFVRTPLPLLHFRLPQPFYLPELTQSQYPATDPSHTGAPTNTVIRYAHTADFKTFTGPKTLIDYAPTSIIDLNILPLDSSGQNYGRFIKNESSPRVFYETSSTGLFGTWSRPGGPDSIIREGTEGPTSYLDNEDPSRAYLLLDYYGSDGYRPFANGDLTTNGWTEADRTSFPTMRRHGSVIGIGQREYDALRARYA